MAAARESKSNEGRKNEIISELKKLAVDAAEACDVVQLRDVITRSKSNQQIPFNLDEIRNSRGETLLMCVAGSNASIPEMKVCEAVLFLLEQGVDVFGKSGGGRTALMEAASFGRTKVAKLLVNSLSFEKCVAFITMKDELNADAISYARLRGALAGKNYNHFIDYLNAKLAADPSSHYQMAQQQVPHAAVAVAENKEEESQFEIMLAKAVVLGIKKFPKEMSRKVKANIHFDISGMDEDKESDQRKIAEFKAMVLEAQGIISELTGKQNREAIQLRAEAYELLRMASLKHFKAYRAAFPGQDWRVFALTYLANQWKCLQLLGGCDKDQTKVMVDAALELRNEYPSIHPNAKGILQARFREVAVQYPGSFTNPQFASYANMLGVKNPNQKPRNLRNYGLAIGAGIGFFAAGPATALLYGLWGGAAGAVTQRMQEKCCGTRPKMKLR